MKYGKSLLIGVTALLITAFSCGAHWYKKKEERRVDSIAKTENTLLVRSYSPTFGPSGAQVTIVEFMDPGCEACADAYPSVKELIKEFDGKVRLVVRYMLFHETSVYAVRALEAAKEQNKYWEALETVFVRQPTWSRHEDPHPELIPSYMEGLGLDMGKLKVSIESSAHTGKMQQDNDDGVALGVNQTPTFFINGRMLDDVNYDTLRSAIRNEL